MTKLDLSKFITTMKNIRDGFILNYNIAPSKFAFFIDLLFKLGNLQSRPNDVIRKIFLPLVDNEECFEMMIDNRFVIAKIFISANNDEQAFLQAIEAKAINTDHKNLIEFAELLKKNRD